MLVSRGLVIKDRQKAENILKQINYYRLRAYTLPFENPPHKFISKVAIEYIIPLFNFCNDVIILHKKLMEKLIDNHTDVPEFWERIGLPENWKKHPLWEG